MDKRRRADRLISSLRWLVIVLGLAAAADDVPVLRLAILVGVVAVYNGALTFATSDTNRYARYGRSLSLAALVMDMVVITAFVATTNHKNSVAYLLYWYPLIACGFTTGNTRKLITIAPVVLLADAGATLYATAPAKGLMPALAIVGIRSGVLAFGALVSAYIAKSRSQDDLASERGSYLHAILDCGARLTSYRSVHELALNVLESAVNEANAAGGELLLVNEETHDMECEAFYTAPLLGQEYNAPQEALLKSYANWVMGSGREILVRSGGKAEEDASVERDDRPAVAVPLLWQSSNTDNDSAVLGVLIVWGSPGDDFNEDAVDMLRIFAALAGAAIVNLRLYTNLQRSFLRTMQSLANGLEARDEYTRGHSERVTSVACLIAQELGVPSENIESLRNAALLHDIGKIGVPDAILRKAGKLTAEEWETMRRHPVVSEEICRPLGLTSEVLFLIKHHQERLDGKGYPAGLSGPEQPLLLRILVVSDAFDAMRSRRPYRDRMPQEELVGELNRSAGRTLDPTVVEAVKRMMDRGDLDAVYEEHDRMIDGTVRSMKVVKKAA